MHRAALSPTSSINCGGAGRAVQTHAHNPARQMVTAPRRFMRQVHETLGTDRRSHHPPRGKSREPFQLKNVMLPGYFHVSPLLAFTPAMMQKITLVKDSSANRGMPMMTKQSGKQTAA